MTNKQTSTNAVDDFMVIPTGTLDFIFSQKNPAELLTLFSFYYKTMKWGNIYLNKELDDLARKELNWGKDKLLTTKKRLKQLNLLEVISSADVSGRFITPTIKLNGILTSETIKNKTEG